MNHTHPRWHATAIIDDEPLRSTTFARRAPDTLPPASLGMFVRVGPYAAIQRGVTLGKGTMVGTHAAVFYGARTGERCVIGRGVEIGPYVTLGDRVKVMGGAILCGYTEVGEGTFIGMGVITTNDDNARRYENKVLDPVRIGSHCQIGAGAVLMPGVVIGDGSLIAGGAVVTHDVAPGSEVMGVPARPPVTRLPRWDAIEAAAR